MNARALMVLTAVPLLASAAPPPVLVSTQVDVMVAVTGLRSDHGVVRACMTSDPQAFPRCRGENATHSLVVKASEPIVFDFTDVAPGTYAIALLHDENDNGKADRALGMMPREGFGFSRDARVHLGPPAFYDAAFTVRAEPVRQTIRMRYLF